MKQSFGRIFLLAGAMVGLQGLSTPAQTGQTTAPTAAESATPQATSSAPAKRVTAEVAQNERAEPRATSSAQSQAGIDEMLKMAQAGVSKEVMKAYVETARVVSPLSAADIVTLKEHGVPDEVTMALVKRGAELAAQGNQSGGSNAVPAMVSGTTSLEALVAALRRGQFNAGRLDPEGYDYFRYYYLYPRTLASVNERLYSPLFAVPFSDPSFGSWGFGPRPFGPRFPGRW